MELKPEGRATIDLNRMQPWDFQFDTMTALIIACLLKIKRPPETVNLAQVIF